jgi:murein DD-endopeptidase MepM/ murein hydrolase activator NlpD
VDSGEKEILALDIANIFQWDIDFDTDLRVGDGFRLLVEKHFREGRLVKYGPILAAEICNQGKNYKGIRFQPPGGRLEYFNTDGRPLRRELRKSPLQFMAPVSSRFSSSRFHPILKIYRPHFGIDYMAPEGMPVVAIADGRVALMGWDSGGGNMIRLEHKGAMSSMYMHLSRFAAGMAQGASIKQGEVIGYVGQTGLSTGPHLDFRILKGNRYLNPTRVQGTPVDPLPAAQMPMFAQTRDNIWARLSAVPLPVNAPQTARK